MGVCPLGVHVEERFDGVAMASDGVEGLAGIGGDGAHGASMEVELARDTGAERGPRDAGDAVGVVERAEDEFEARIQESAYEHADATAHGTDVCLGRKPRVREGRQLDDAEGVAIGGFDQDAVVVWEVDGKCQEAIGEGAAAFSSKVGGIAGWCREWVWGGRETFKFCLGREFQGALGGMAVHRSLLAQICVS